MKKQKGFSLVELLVVITIIIVISAVAMVNYAGAGKKSRDSRRIADLEKIRMALESVRQVGNTYPSSLSILETGGYLSKIPVDPKSGTYLYTRVSGYSYNVKAVMEDLGSTNGDYAGAYNYQVTNL